MGIIKKVKSVTVKIDVNEKFYNEPSESTVRVGNELVVCIERLQKTGEIPDFDNIQYVNMETERIAICEYCKREWEEDEETGEPCCCDKAITEWGKNKNEKEHA